MKAHATLRDTIIYFSDYEHCKDFMVSLRWPDGKVKCPHCGSEKVCYLAKSRVWKCYADHPKPRFTLKTGTIFEDSPIALEKWLPATWLVMNCKNGISSWELSRDLGVTQKTAWFMLHRIRLAMQDDLSGGMLGGEVEIDETFIGGKARNMHESKKRQLKRKIKEAGTAGGLYGGHGKAIVLGMLERGGRVRATVVPDRTKSTMQPVVRGNVGRGSDIFADEHVYNWKMPNEYYHNVINHLETYVDGNVHTNGIENFWSLLKRGLGGTYVSVEPFHLFRYVGEQAFRFNNRDMEDIDRFVYGMRHVVGRRLTYAELTGKAGETHG
ncbi:MAG TPA: IS1595 family transposase [Bryobacteraceae bacterium]|nr:IS1595 family transposase [Bryobacteraceae bacterium]